MCERERERGRERGSIVSTVDGIQRIESQKVKIYRTIDTGLWPEVG